MAWRTYGGVALAALLSGLLAWCPSAPERSDLVRALRASEVRGELREAHACLLGARVDVYEGDFRSASRRLEGARTLLRRAGERAEALDWRDTVTRVDLAWFEAELDTAQQLLRRLDQADVPPGGDGHAVDEARRGAALVQR